MSTDRRGRFAQDDPATRGRLPLAVPQEVRSPARDPSELTIAPDHRPRDEQPQWRKDFPIDWPLDHYVSRRDLARYLVLTSGAFVVGHGWIAAQSVIRQRSPAWPRVRVASLRDLPVGGAVVFDYPTERDKCLLIRPEPDLLVAYSQACTHLSCPVVPRVSEGVLHCPCHEGLFDLRTGRNIAGPPPRPLPRIELDVQGGEVFAVGVVERTV